MSVTVFVSQESGHGLDGSLKSATKELTRTGSSENLPRGRIHIQAHKVIGRTQLFAGFGPEDFHFFLAVI